MMQSLLNGAVSATNNDLKAHKDSDKIDTTATESSKSKLTEEQSSFSKVLKQNFEQDTAAVEKKANSKGESQVAQSSVNKTTGNNVATAAVQVSDAEAGTLATSVQTTNKAGLSIDSNQVTSLKGSIDNSVLNNTTDGTKVLGEAQKNEATSTFNVTVKETPQVQGQKTVSSLDTATLQQPSLASSANINYSTLAEPVESKQQVAVNTEGGTEATSVEAIDNDHNQQLLLSIQMAQEVNTKVKVSHNEFSNNELINSDLSKNELANHVISNNDLINNDFSNEVTGESASEFDINNQLMYLDASFAITDDNQTNLPIQNDAPNLAVDSALLGTATATTDELASAADSATENEVAGLTTASTSNLVSTADNTLAGDTDNDLAEGIATMANVSASQKVEIASNDDVVMTSNNGGTSDPLVSATLQNNKNATEQQLAATVDDSVTKTDSSNSIQQNVNHTEVANSKGAEVLAEVSKGAVDKNEVLNVAANKASIDSANEQSKSTFKNVLDTSSAVAGASVNESDKTKLTNADTQASLSNASAVTSQTSSEQLNADLSSTLTAKTLEQSDGLSSTVKHEGLAATQAVIDVNGAKPNQTSLAQLDKLMAGNQQQQASNNLLQQPLDIQSKQAAAMMGERVMMMISQGKQEVQIRLDPAELGSMFIKVQVQHEQVQLNIQTQAGLSKDIIEQNMPRLREQLAQQGIQLGEANVQQQSQQQGQQQQNNGMKTVSGTQSHTNVMAEEEQTATWMPSKLPSTDQGIDFYA